MRTFIVPNAIAKMAIPNARGVIEQITVGQIGRNPPA
jgi:hypothetical protein